MFAASRTLWAVDLTLAMYWPEGGNGGEDVMLTVDESQKPRGAERNCLNL